MYYDETSCGTIPMDILRDIAECKGEGMPDVEEFLQEAQQFADASGNVDYRSFAQMMCSEE